MITKTLDDLYKELFAAQLDKNWGLVAKVQREISRTERESPLVEDSEDVRDNEGTV